MEIQFADGSTAECDITDEFFSSLEAQVKRGTITAHIVVNIQGFNYHINVLDVKRVAIANPSNIDRAQLARLGGKIP